MKTLIAIVSIAFLTALSANILPWWICGVIAFAVTMIMRLPAGASFLAGLLGVAFAWGISAGLADAQNDSVLSTRIGELFFGLPSLAVVCLTAILGGLVGGLAGWTGSALAIVIYKKERTGISTAR
jgi:hypothetical protein